MMSCVARTKQVSTTFYSVSQSHPGLTLYAPLDGKEAVLVNMVGKVIHRWELEHKPGAHAELLPNGNLLYAGKNESGPLADFEGAGGILREVDKQGTTVWEYADDYLHHSFRRLENGNTLALRWVEVPAETAAKVKGGLSGSEIDGRMWGDEIIEIDPKGAIVWSWKAHEHLDPQMDSICPVCARSEWTHATTIDVLENGNVLLNCMRTNEIIVVAKSSGSISLRWGKEELSHPNGASVTREGRFLIFDSGRHCEGEGQGFSRAIEFDPKKFKMVWGYEEDPPVYLYSSFLGSAQRLPNGNTLLCEGTTGRMLEVNTKGAMAWEYVVPDEYESEKYRTNRYIFNAKRYGLDYVGLRKFYGHDRDWFMWNDLEVNKDEAAAQDKKADVDAEDLIRSRLEPLGY
jgi:hypothetical protein